jgi:hypothetical protein
MERSFKNGPVVAVLVVATLLAVYVGGYFALSDWHDAAISIREFGPRWQAVLFRPLVHVESACLGRTILLCSDQEIVADINGWTANSFGGWTPPSSTHPQK